MPVTIAHPAAALPLKKLLGGHLSLSALAIGSMVPDLVYLVPLGIRRADTHDVWALLWFCLPAGLVSYIAFHLLLCPAGARILPRRLRCRLPSSAFVGRLPTTAWILVSASLLLGAATHLAVDSLTHRDGFVVARIPVLQFQLCAIAGYKVCVYKILQHAGGVAGLALLWRWLRLWERRTPPNPDSIASQGSPGLHFAAACLLILAPIAAGIFLTVLQHGAGNWLLATKSAWRTFLMGGGSTFLLTWAALGILCRIPGRPPGAA